MVPLPVSAAKVRPRRPARRWKLFRARSNFSGDLLFSYLDRLTVPDADIPHADLAEPVPDIFCRPVAFFRHRALFDIGALRRQVEQDLDDGVDDITPAIIFHAPGLYYGMKMPYSITKRSTHCRSILRQRYIPFVMLYGFLSTVKALYNHILRKQQPETDLIIPFANTED